MCVFAHLADCIDRSLMSDSSMIIRFVLKHKVTNKKGNPEQEFTMLESLCEMGQSPSAEGAADGGVKAAGARDGGGSL